MTINKRFGLFFVFLWAALSVNSVIAAPPEAYAFKNLTEAFQQAKAEGKPIFLYFGRYGCSTCRKMHAEVFTDAGLESQYNKDFVLAYVDTESSNRIQLPNGERTTEMQFTARNRIRGTPTFIYFSAEQKPLFQRGGFQTIEQMAAYATYVSDGIYQSQNLQQYLESQ